MFGLVSRLGAGVDVRDSFGHVYAYAIDDLDDTLEEPTIDIGHIAGTDCGEAVYVELAEAGDHDQLAAVAVIEGSAAEAVAGLDGPIYFSGSYAVPGSPHLRQRSFVAERGQLLSLSITTEPANSSARPLDWKRGDVRSSGDRSGWEISWRSQAPLLARAADQLTGSLRYRSATRIIDRRPRDDYPWQLRAGDRVPSGLRTRELPGGLWKSAHRGRIISVR